MKTTTLNAIRKAAEAAGATILQHDGETAILDYEGVTITVDRIQPTATCWFTTVEGNGIDRYSLGAEKSPSKAVKFAVEFAERRLQAQADAENNLFDTEEPAEVDEPIRDYPIDEDPADDDAPLLTDVAEVRNSVAEVFQFGDADHTTTVEELREMCEIAEEVDDEDIIEALAEVVRDGGAPFLAFVLNDGRIEACVEVERSDTPEAMSAALDAAAIELSGFVGETITLARVGDMENDGGVLFAYRVPSADFAERDVEDTLRFGVEVGRYRMVTETEDTTLAVLTAAMKGKSHDWAGIRNGVAQVVIGCAPGTPSGWSVDVRATRERIVAQFDHRSGPEAHAVWEPSTPEARSLAFEEFIRAPVKWASDMWAIVESRREAA